MKQVMQTSLQAALLSAGLLLSGCGQILQSDSKETVDANQQPLSGEAEHMIIAEQQRQAIIKQSSLEWSAAPKKMTKMPYMQQRMQIDSIQPPAAMIDNENYSHNSDNPFTLVTEQSVSTFSIDVDTASYSNVRRILNQGSLPRHDAVRIEEMINYFSYDYPLPKNQPFSVYSEVGPSPYNAEKHLIHIGIQGEKLPASARPSANLVFLLDVSGSMNSANKLGLLKNALKMLSKQLSEKDRVAIVVYAGAAGTVLEPTSGDNSGAIIDALERLSAGGSTNGGRGIELAYRLARQSFIKDGINRVILATDGDFNVGMVNQQALKNRVEEQRKSGVELTILGFGRGNYNDALMQELAQNGNGNAFYIDNLNEARKVLVEELSSTLFTIANDVKIQVEFNPSKVSEYRLIGYETRALKRQDFNNDKVDAGDIGAGHTVTAIYEITLQGAENPTIDPLRYQAEDKKAATNHESNELAFVKLRYKEPKQSSSKLLQLPIKTEDIKTSMQATSETFQFSTAVAGFAQLLRGGENLADMDMKQIIALAQNSKGTDKHGYRSEFINMVKLADALAPKVAE